MGAGLVKLCFLMKVQYLISDVALQFMRLRQKQYELDTSLGVLQLYLRSSISKEKAGILFSLVLMLILVSFRAGDVGRSPPAQHSSQEEFTCIIMHTGRGCCWSTSTFTHQVKFCCNNKFKLQVHSQTFSAPQLSSCFNVVNISWKIILIMAPQIDCFFLYRDTPSAVCVCVCVLDKDHIKVVQLLNNSSLSIVHERFKTSTRD